MRALVGAFALIAGLLVAAPAPSASAQDLPRAGFDWEMAPRFGTDSDRDGRLEIENSAAYAHNRITPCPQRCPAPGFQVTLSATPTPEQMGLPSRLLSYEWRLDGRGGAHTHHELAPDLVLRLAEGEYDVDLRVKVRLPWGRVTQRARGTMVVEDLVVVALGDSYASGEGSPDVPLSDDEPAQWADASDPAVEAEHALAHRSSIAWPVRVALALEDASRRTSVTFIDLSSSGARIDRGLVGERTQPPLAAQVDDLAAILHDRDVDLLLLQVGGNDVGFSRLIRALVDADPQLDPLCYDVMLDNIWAAVDDGGWDRGVRIRYRPPFTFSCEGTGSDGPLIPGLEGLPAAFDRLAQALERFSPGRVLLVEYPDPTGSPAPGELCQEIVGDVTPPFTFHEVDEREQQSGVTRLLDPLNAALAEIAADRGWTFVGGVAAEFAAGHGYCAPWPDYGYPDWFERSPLVFQDRLDAPEGWYRVPGRYGTPLLINAGTASWYRTAAQSAVLQGPVPRFLTAGTLHPNEQGHLAIARIVLAAIAD